MRHVASWVCVAAIVAVAFWTRAAHPHLTETELFIAFFPRWVAAIGLGAFVAWLSRR